MSNFHPQASSNSSQWFSNSYDTCVTHHAPILSPIRMVAYKSQNSTYWILFLALTCHIFHMSAIRSEFVILVIESSIIFCHRVRRISFQVAHMVFQSLPFPWELLSFTNSNYLAHYMLFDTTYPSNNVTLPMCSNWMKIIPSVCEIQSPKGSTSFQVSS